MRKIQIGKYRQIDKRVARRLYNEGKDILFIPCNLRPDNAFGLGIVENKDLDGQYESFDKLVDWYQWYNCTYTEVGRYVSFYEIVEE